MIKCPNCNAELSFSPKDQMITCEYCKSSFSPQDLKIKIKKSEESNTFEGKSYMCSSCGAKLMTFDETAVTFCSYCGSQAMIESKMMKVNNPDYALGLYIRCTHLCTHSYCIKLLNLRPHSFWKPKTLALILAKCFYNKLKKQILMKISA